jgi:hypothetical protein
VLFDEHREDVATVPREVLAAVIDALALVETLGLGRVAFQVEHLVRDLALADSCPRHD